MQCLVVLLLLVGAGSCSRVSYCGAKICRHTNGHTFCQFPEGPSPTCMGYIDAPLTSDEKVRIIARLNRRRSEAASGRLRNLPPAGNMLKLRWVEELARSAQRWADQCRPASMPEEQDMCRDLYSVTVGQCVASVVGEAPGLKIESMIDLWHMQAILYRGNVTTYIPPTSSTAYYGDFAQMLWAKTYMVGCGRSRFMAPWRGRLRSTERLVCNFAPRGPVAARALWVPGPPAAACSTRSLPDRVLTALCTYQPGAFNEMNSSMPLEEYVALNTVLDIENNESLNYHGSLDEMYLTKIAMLTMNNVILSTEYYNSVQKRDIADIVLLEDAKADVYKIAYERDMQNNIPTDLPQTIPQEFVKTLKTHKEKVSLIGRPKTYNMEELNDVKHENVHNEELEGISRNEKDLYTDYDFKENDDDNDTITEALTAHVTIENTNRAKEVEINLTKYGNSANISFDATTVKDEEFNMNKPNNDVSNESISVENPEDYLNDSETVRELQEALERMEQTLGPELSEGQGKVRRDIRDMPGGIKPEGNKYPDDSRVKGQETGVNKSSERGPMMNMVLKYLPYLKQYQNGLLSNDGSCVQPCVVLILTLFSL